MNVLISLSCSTLSILRYFNKHIHAGVVSHLAPIQYLCGSSVLFCGWFIQPLTGGSLWTSEHIRRQTQEPSALIMSDQSVHGHEIHFLPPSIYLWLHPSHSHTDFILHIYITAHTLRTNNIWGQVSSEGSLSYWGAIFTGVTRRCIKLIYIGLC